MLHIPKIDYSKILTHEEVKDILAINVSQYLKPARGKLYSKMKNKIFKKLLNRLISF